MLATKSIESGFLGVKNSNKVEMIFVRVKVLSLNNCYKNERKLDVTVTGSQIHGENDRP